MNAIFSRAGNACLAVSFLLWLMLSPGVSCGGDDPPLETQIEKIKSKLLLSRDFRTTGSLYRQIFTMVPPDDWDKFKVGKDVGLALHAAWEKNVVVLPWYEYNMDLKSNIILKSEDAQRFFGFFEGKTGVLVPSWWAGKGDFPNRHKSDRGNDDAEPGSVRNYKQCDFVLSDYSRFQMHIPKGASISTAKSKYIYRDKYGWSSVLPFKIHKIDKAAVSVGPNLLVVTSEKNSVGIILSELATDFSIYCWDSNSGRTLWSEKVWGQGFNGNLAGMCDATVDIELTKDRATVFGAGSFDYFAESFRLKDGTPEFRFSTGYWEMWNVSPIIPKERLTQDE